jgi:hypothetical protein
VAVGGAWGSGKWIPAFLASYEARRFGVRSAMPTVPSAGGAADDPTTLPGRFPQLRSAVGPVPASPRCRRHGRRLSLARARPNSSPTFATAPWSGPDGSPPLGNFAGDCEKSSSSTAALGSVQTNSSRSWRRSGPSPVSLDGRLVDGEGVTVADAATGEQWLRTLEARALWGVGPGRRRPNWNVSGCARSSRAARDCRVGPRHYRFGRAVGQSLAEMFLGQGLIDPWKWLARASRSEAKRPSQSL